MTLKIDFQNQILALFDGYFWPFNKSNEKIKSVFVISAIWNVFIKFHWHDEKLTAGCLALKSTTVIMLLKRCTEVCHKAMKMSRNIFVRSAQKSFFQKREWNSIKETNVWARKKSIVTYVSRKKNSGLQLYSLGTSCEVSKRKIQNLSRFAKFCECSNEVLKYFTPPRTPRISRLKSQILNPLFLS